MAIGSPPPLNLSTKSMRIEPRLFIIRRLGYVSSDHRVIWPKPMFTPNAQHFRGKKRETRSIDRRFIQIRPPPLPCVAGPARAAVVRRIIESRATKTCGAARVPRQRGAATNARITQLNETLIDRSETAVGVPRSRKVTRFCNVCLT